MPSGLGRAAEAHLYFGSARSRPMFEPAGLGQAFIKFAKPGPAQAHLASWASWAGLYLIFFIYVD